LADRTARWEVAEATVDSFSQAAPGGGKEVEGHWRPVAALCSEGQRKMGMGTMADRKLLTHWIGHAPLQKERDDALEEEGRCKEEVALTYCLFQPFRQW
jgi:hypothetical protein